MQHTDSRQLLFSIAIVLIGGVIAHHTASAQERADNWRWLEKVDSEESLDWVRSRNARFLEKAESDPWYEPTFDRLLAMFDDTSQIDYPGLRDETVYNFLQRGEHERGLIRRTDLRSYLAGEEEWQEVLDIDRLAREERENWVYKGSTVWEPDPRLTLIHLSRGGADASVVREFDRSTGEFVADGFVLPEAKSRVVWIGPDEILVGTDLGDSSLTTSGYPRTIRRWRRGESIADAPVIFEGEPEDVSVAAWVHHGPDRDYVFLERGMTFYTGQSWLLDGDELLRIDVPEDASIGMFRDILLLKLQSDWTIAGVLHRAGSLISIAMADFLDGSRTFQSVHVPAERETIEYFLSGRDVLYLSTLENVRGRVREFRYVDRSWQGSTINTPSIGSVSLQAHDPHSNRLFLTYTDYLTPTTLFYYDPDESDELRTVRQQPSYFDADPFTVEQLSATSADGTEIPYFLIRPNDLDYDGTAPTVLYGYGGFRVSLTPSYSGSTGIAWLEEGGVYVVANIRGGGEFGPDWHASALKENRQRAYDDFIAVAEDLVAQQITSPQHLGIMGGSNGGLLVGAVTTQRPDLFNAVVCAVPLLDMKNYHTMLAGASWMGEYGNPDIPEEWEYISRYSPYHNLKEEATYPEVLFTTSTRDDRVHPGHARKMAARMEEMGHPCYYFENIEGGHGGATNNRQTAQRIALTFAYFRWKLIGESPE